MNNSLIFCSIFYYQRWQTEELSATKKNIKKNYVIKNYKLELEWMLRHVYISVFLYEWIEYKKRLCNTVLIDAVRRASHYTIC